MKRFGNVAWLLVLGQVFFSLPTQAEPGPVTGTIQSIERTESGQIMVTLDNEGQATSFLVDSNTIVQGMSPAKQLRKGRRVLSSSASEGGAGGGGKRSVMPFQNMSAKQKKMLGLPDLPKIPEVPQMPNIPKIPKVPTVPKVPGQPAGKAGAAGMEGEPAAAGIETGEGEAPASAVAPKPRTQPQDVTPEKDTLAKLIPDKPLFEAGSESSFEIKQVVNLKTTPKGIEIELMGSRGGSEKMVVSPDEAFVQLLDLRELKQGMKVSASLADADEGAVAQQITVL